MKRIFSDIQIKFIKDNYKTTTYVEMSKMLLFKGLTDKQIRNKARSLGIKKTRTFNDTYFDEINKKEKAYFLGLIYADGYISNECELGISLIYTDRRILDLLNQELGGVHIVKERKRNTSFNGYDYITHSADFRVYSKPIYDGLTKNGISARKTNSNIYPKIDGEFIQHFIRGYFDGDGCVYKHTHQGYNMVHFTCSNKKFLEYLDGVITKNIGIHGKIYKEKDKKYRLMYYRRTDAESLLNYMYYDSDNLRLERKYEKHLYIGSPMKETIG